MHSARQSSCQLWYCVKVYYFLYLYLLIAYGRCEGLGCALQSTQQLRHGMRRGSATQRVWPRRRVSGTGWRSGCGRRRHGLRLYAACRETPSTEASGMLSECRIARCCSRLGLSAVIYSMSNFARLCPPRCCSLVLISTTLLVSLFFNVLCVSKGPAQSNTAVASLTGTPCTAGSISSPWHPSAWTARTNRPARSSPARAASSCTRPTIAKATSSLRQRFAAAFVAMVWLAGLYTMRA